MAINDPSDTVTQQGADCKVMVFSPCSKSKYEGATSITVTLAITPTDYLSRIDLISTLVDTRQHILINMRRQDPSSVSVPALDLYVKAPRSHAYQGIRKSCGDGLKKRLFSQDVQWFFLSGGYGVVHALENTRRYEATFNERKIERVWSQARLSAICQDIVDKFNPSRIYILGSPKYLEMVKAARFYSSAKIFEGFAKPRDSNAGNRWLSDILMQLATGLIQNDFKTFDQNYPKQYNPNV
jgi:hypothetical protein